MDQRLLLLRRRSEPLQPWWKGQVTSGQPHSHNLVADRFLWRQGAPKASQARRMAPASSLRTGVTNWQVPPTHPTPKFSPPVRILQDHHQASLSFSGNRQELLNTCALKMAVCHQRRITSWRSHNKRVSSMHHRCHTSHTSHQVNALKISFAKNEVSLDMVYWYTFPFNRQQTQSSILAGDNDLQTPL